MPRLALSVPIALLLVSAVPVWSQSIKTEGNIETDAQLVSKVATGTAPLEVSSTTMVPSLNADQVDGLEGTALALDADLQAAETLLAALQAQVDALGLALVPRTGQANCYDAAGVATTCGTGLGLAQDGDLKLGVTWPNPRFTINESSPGVPDGTVTDNLTGLIWLADATCWAAQMSWADALDYANTLFDGSTSHDGGDCDLGDGSLAGAWRLPNLRELQSLVHYGVSSPALPNTAGTGQWQAGDPFSSVHSGFYWSSTTDVRVTADPPAAWVVAMADGDVNDVDKTDLNRVWPVRGGQ